MLTWLDRHASESNLSRRNSFPALVLFSVSSVSLW
jgi:hypothetical protein